MFNLGNLLGPLIAGFLSDQFDYTGTTDIMGVCAFFYTIFFYFGMIFRKDLK